MAIAKKITETKTVTTGIELRLTPDEAKGLHTLLYRAVGQLALDRLKLRSTMIALSDVGIDYGVSFARTAQVAEDTE